MNSKCLCVGFINQRKFNEMTGRVYHPNGLSPAIRTFSGGNTEVKIIDETDLPKPKG